VLGSLRVGASPRWLAVEAGRGANGPTKAGLLAASALLALVALALPSSAAAIKLPGELFGPNTVRPGVRYHWHGIHLAPSEAVHASVQPRYCYGKHGCIARVRGAWRSTASGTTRLAFVFPRRYLVRCALHGCQRHPTFRAGEEVVVRTCVNGPTSGAHYGYRCLIKTVHVGGGRT
jgi:hypothetical protein